MTPSEAKRIAADPAAFRARLLIDADGSPCRLGDRLEPWQAADFAALDPAWRRVAGHRVEGSKQRAYLERPRGHSKTSDLAVMVSWALLVSRRRLAGVAAAADRDQARLLRDAIDKLVRANAWLGEVLDVQAYKIVNRHTGSELEILSSDAATSYGLTPDFILCDELTHWPKRDLWDSLISSAAKRARCLVVVISNAGWGDTWQWATREAIRTDPDWHFSRLDGPTASWITPKLLDEQRRLLPAIAFDRLWMNRWTSGSGDALRENDIQAAVSLPGPIVEPERGWVYVGGLDLGLTRDASALVVLGVHIGHVERERVKQPEHQSTAMRAMAELGMIETKVASSETTQLVSRVPGTGRMRVAHLKMWRPTAGSQVSIEAIEETILRLDERFRLACLAFDPWQAQYLTERLRRARVPTMQVDFSAANLREMATTTLEAFSERQVELFHDADLLQDLRALRAVEKSYGMRLESPRGPRGHGDTATALSIALLAARRAARTTQRINRPLLAAVY